MSAPFDTDRVVSDRYAAAAEQQEAALCCPVDYDPRYLEIIPAEVIERDYGCGDPSKQVRPGETVLDLGSGGGKICFIAAQVVGPTGQVIGVDMNDAMLELAKRSQQTVAARLGYDNVSFRRGKIQDLALDRDAVDAFLRNHPVQDERSLRELEAFQTQARQTSPLVADHSIDVVVSNCVLNLVDPAEKAKLFAEIYRVLKPAGRAVISDIVADEPVPAHLQATPELWSGCISGAFLEREFLRHFEAAGFCGIELETLQKDPWRTVEGIEFRAATVVAYKPAAGPCLEHHEAVIYRGPFRKVFDDEGHGYERGERIAVCRKTFERLSSEPYADHFIPVEPHHTIAAEAAQPFPCQGTKRRSPRITKGENYRRTDQAAGDCCGPTGCA